MEKRDFDVQVYRVKMHLVLQSHRQEKPSVVPMSEKPLLCMVCYVNETYTILFAQIYCLIAV